MCKRKKLKYIIYACLSKNQTRHVKTRENNHFCASAVIEYSNRVLLTFEEDCDSRVSKKRSYTKFYSE